MTPWALACVKVTPCNCFSELNPWNVCHIVDYLPIGDYQFINQCIDCIFNLFNSTHRNKRLAASLTNNCLTINWYQLHKAIGVNRIFSLRMFPTLLKRWKIVIRPKGWHWVASTTSRSKDCAMDALHLVIFILHVLWPSFIFFKPAPCLHLW